MTKRYFIIIFGVHFLSGINAFAQKGASWMASIQTQGNGQSTFKDSVGTWQGSTFQANTRWLHFKPGSYFQVGGGIGMQHYESNWFINPRNTANIGMDGFYAFKVGRQKFLTGGNFKFIFDPVFWGTSGANYGAYAIWRPQLNKNWKLNLGLSFSQSLGRERLLPLIGIYGKTGKRSSLNIMLPLRISEVWRLKSGGKIIRLWLQPAGQGGLLSNYYGEFGWQYQQVLIRQTAYELGTSLLLPIKNGFLFSMKLGARGGQKITVRNPDANQIIAQTKMTGSLSVGLSLIYRFRKSVESPYFDTDGLNLFDLDY